MEEGYTSLPTSHLIGSVQAAVIDDKTASAPSQTSANLQPSPFDGGYLGPRNPIDAGQTTSSWKGAFNVSSYSPYFNVDSDVVLDRIVSSVYPMNDFHRKINGNPDLYGPIWIPTTLIFMLAALGNVGTYLMHKRKDPTATWIFDVSYLDWAACIIFGYTLAVPVAFYFLLKYHGQTTSLIGLWCMWGYSLFIFLPSCLLLAIPVEVFRWIIIILAGVASSWFVAVNLNSYAQANNVMIVVIGAAVLQFVLALFIKMFFFA